MLIFTLLPGLLESSLFLFAVVAFIMAIRFFKDSRKRLQELAPGGVAKQRTRLPFEVDRSGFVLPQTPTVSKQKGDTKKAAKQMASDAQDVTRDEIRELRLQVRQQQEELEKALEKMDYIGQHAYPPEEKTAIALAKQEKLEELRMDLEEKEAEIQRLKQQEKYALKMQERFEDVQAEFEKLQAKMQQMEGQAWQTAELNIQLENAEQAQLQLEQTLQKKEEKLRELTLENNRLQDYTNQLEDQLAEANLQRQQLSKKAQLLEAINTDMMQMAETNRKLKSEIARVAELESMLNLISEERTLLKR